MSYFLELNKLSAEEWIVFRKKVYLLEQFNHDWQVKLQKIESTPLVTRMLQEILKYEEAIPALKYLRGEDFTDKHWLEAFSIIGLIPKSLDNLFLKDFLAVSETLIDSTAELQVKTLILNHTFDYYLHDNFFSRFVKKLQVKL